MKKELKEIEYKDLLKEHELIKVHNEDLFGTMYRFFTIQKHTIGFCALKDLINKNYFEFHDNLNQDVISNLKPILIKWSNESKVYFNDENINKIKQINKEILNAIKSL